MPTTAQALVIDALIRDVARIEAKLAKARRIPPTHASFDVLVPRYERELAQAQALLQAKVATA